MPDTEITTLAVLGERLRNVMAVLTDMKGLLQTEITAMNGKIATLATRKEIEVLVSKSEHSAAIVALDNRLGAVEKRVEANAPARLIDTFTKFCLSISAVGAAGTLVWKLVRSVP
jgi:hypothetical protein